MLYKYIIRPLLMLRDPEDAHEMALRVLTKASRSKTWSGVLRALFTYENKKLQTRCFGLDFKNPVGLAADLIRTLF